MHTSAKPPARLLEAPAAAVARLPTVDVTTFDTDTDLREPFSGLYFKSASMLLLKQNYLLLPFFLVI